MQKVGDVVNVIPQKVWAVVFCKAYNNAVPISYSLFGF